MRRIDDNPNESMEMLPDHHSNPPIANGSSGGAVQISRTHSITPNRVPLFDRASARWWNPQFASSALELQYCRCSFPQLRERLRFSNEFREVCGFEANVVQFAINSVRSGLLKGIHDIGYNDELLGKSILVKTVPVCYLMIIWGLTLNYVLGNKLCMSIRLPQRSGLLYMVLMCVSWIAYLIAFNQVKLIHMIVAFCLVAVLFGLIFFTSRTFYYQRFYLPSSFLCVFTVCIVTLLIFSDVSHSFMSPVGSLNTSFQVILLIYTVIPLPLYSCILTGVIYSVLFELLSNNNIYYDDAFGIKLILHLGIHLLGVHLFILTQVRQRKTFLKVGQSLLARKDLEIETQFKDHMIQSVMPKMVAEELLKETSIRRSSASQDAYLRCNDWNSGDQRLENRSLEGISESAGTLLVRNARKFRPFTMNLMSNVSILFADIAGFTRMSANKSADELVNLLNDLFGRFDHLCGKCNLEKISTLGDCYYCVGGCPEARVDHARCCVEMGLAMIVAIQQFDVDRHQTVNMRVGIHTGKVMCGMVGIKRFKFDVFSNDVTLANEMESTGIAGRVHISEATANFLNNEYILEEGDPHAGMKTYFIVGCIRDIDSATKSASCANSARDVVASEMQLNRSQISLRKRLTNKLKMIHANSLPVDRSATDSVKIKSLERKLESNSVQILNRGYPNERGHLAPIVYERRKSASLQTLPFAEACYSSSHERVVNEESSHELVQGVSLGNSGPGSKSSGMQESSSDAFSLAGALDTIISHHHNAASLTHFDTENRDFDERLAQVIQHVGLNFARGFWQQDDSLNRWTLRFNEREIENRYRSHFADSVDRHSSSRSISGRKLPISREIEESSTQYRYSGVFIDMLVAAVLLVVSAAVILISRNNSIPFFIYFGISLAFVIVVLVTIGVPLLRRRVTLPLLNLWMQRHILGMILISLPVGIALSIIPRAHQSSPSSSSCNTLVELPQQIIFSYVFLIALFAHCNFSQLSAWPKTLQAAIVVAIFVAITFITQRQLPPSYYPTNATGLELLMSNTSSTPACDTSLPLWSKFSEHSPICVWEIVLNVCLALVLVAFLNYQFEAAFRMSFFGDVRAHRDTQKMRAVRDQADWLLTNIIPQHAIDSLKLSTKYSENHTMTGVLFLTITNWNEMYEETFEGGREFLRVLNEIISDFDELLDRTDFSQVEKIKTIGPTYMAASGLNSERQRQAVQPYEHLYQLIEFALGLQQQLSYFNQDLLNFDFICKLGYNIGPVTAGVIGTTKLYYDIWGDTVNIASRMYSTGVENRIQVSQYTRDILCDRYDFEYRDHIEVKGVDGGMDTYLLVGRKGEPPITFSNPD